MNESILQHMIYDIENKKNNNNSKYLYYYNNTPVQFQKDFNVFSGTKEEYVNHIKSNIDLFNSSQLYDEIRIPQNMDKSIMGYDAQYSQWMKAKEIIENEKGTIFSFDLETIGDIFKYKDSKSTSGVTEIGFTKTVLNGAKTTNESFAVAFGVNQKQVQEALALFKKAENSGMKIISEWQRKQGIEGITKSEFSLIERYGRYAGEIADVFEPQNIKGLGSGITTVKSLSESAAYNIAQSYEGLINLAVLGGDEQSAMANLLKPQGLDKKFLARKQIFMSSGMQFQNMQSGVFSKTINLITESANDVNTITTGYNIDLFDIPILNKFRTTENMIHTSQVLDLYHGAVMASDSNNLMPIQTLEAYAKKLGIKYAAHTSDADTYVNNQLMLAKEFANGKSFIQSVEDAFNNINKGSFMNMHSLTGENKPVLFALNSILYDKNALDSLQDGNGNILNYWNDYGINRGRYYTVESIKSVEGKIGVQFKTAGTTTPEETRIFTKVFDADEFRNAMQSFSLESMEGSDLPLPKVSQRTIQRQEAIYKTDLARRNYENMFKVSSIELNTNSQEYVGGYEKLNKFLEAYDALGYDMTDDVIKEIGEGKHRDSVIKVLKEKNLFFDGDKINKVQLASGMSNVRDFESLVRIVKDEESVLRHIQKTVKDKDLNVYQQTQIANIIRGRIENVIHQEYENIVPYDGIKMDYSKAIRQDLFNIEVNYDTKSAPINVNFEKPSEATKTMYNRFKSLTANSDNQNVTMVDMMLSALDTLRRNDIIDKDTYKKFRSQYGGLSSTTNAWHLAKDIATNIHTQYVIPLQEKGYNLEMLQSGDFSSLDNNLINFITKKGPLLGELNYSKSRSRMAIKNSNLETVISLSDAFDILKSDKANILDAFTNEALQFASSMQFDIHKNRDQIKDILRNQLHYDEENIGRVDRMLFQVKKDGSPYGLTTYKSETGKTDFVTQFLHTGEDGDNAFILVNTADDVAKRNSIMDLMADNTKSMREKIDIVIEKEYASVFELPAINTNTEMLKDIDGISTNKIYKTITYGQGDAQKIVRQRLSVWEMEPSLAETQLAVTDDINEILKSFQLVRNNLVEDLHAKEYGTGTRRFKRATDSVISKMAGPSGIQVIPVLDEARNVIDWEKRFIPNIADMMQSAKISIAPLQKIVIQTAMETNDIEMMGLLSRFSDDFDGVLELPNQVVMEKLIANLDEYGNISPQFSEFFYKHFNLGNFSEESGFENVTIKGSFLEYLHNKTKGKDKKTFHQSIIDTVDMFWKNKDNISQLVKEKEASDFYISMADNSTLNQWNMLDSGRRPTVNQQGTAKFYNRELMEKELSTVIGKESNAKTRAEKLELSIGYDVMPKQREQLFSNIKDTHGEFETHITGYAKQMSPLSVMKSMEEFETMLRSDDISSLAKQVAEYNVEEFDFEALERAFLLIKERGSNAFESKASLRPSLGNTSMFTSPDLRRISITPITEWDNNTYINGSDSIKGLRETKYLATGDIIGQGENEFGKTLDVVYKGPSGYLMGDVDEFLKTGKGIIRQEKEGMQDVKIFLGNEKQTASIIEYNPLDPMFKIFKNKETFYAYTDVVYDNVFGYKTSAVSNLEIGKHLSGGSNYGGYLNEIYRAFNDAIETEGFETVEKRFSNLIATSGKGMGLNTGFQLIGLDHSDRLKNPSRHFSYDVKQMTESGIHTQIENMINIIRDNAANETDGGFWTNLMGKLDYSNEESLFLTSISRQIMNETMGEVVYLDNRMAINMSSQFMEDIGEELISDRNNPGWNVVQTAEGLKSFGKYLTDKIVEESLDDAIFDSQVSNLGIKSQSSNSTIRGMFLSLKHAGSPDEAKDFINVLNIDLDDINIVGAGKQRDSYTNSLVKQFDGEKIVYSNLLKNAAEKQGIDLDSVDAVRINLTKNKTKGIAYDLNLTGDKVIKNLDSILFPLYDVTPYKGKVYYSNLETLINDVLRTAKGFGDNGGIEKSRNDLSKSVSRYIAGLGNEMSSQKKSYLHNKALKVPMKNSGMFFAQSTIPPIVTDMVENNDLWLTDANYREALIDAVARGDNSKYKIDLYASKLTGRSYTSIVETVLENGEKGTKLIYDDIAELSKEGFERLGYNFQDIGMDLYFNRRNYQGIRVEDIAEVQKLLEPIRPLGNFDKALKDYNDILKIQGLLSRQSQEWIDEETERLARKTGLSPDIRVAFGKLNKQFEVMGIHYAEDVGIHGSLIRYPVFHEGGIRLVTKFKLNKYGLGEDEIITTAAQGAKLNLDHDGDNLFAKLLFDNNRIMDKSRSGVYYDVVEKLYEKQTRDNALEMADILKSSHKFINNFQSDIDKVSDINKGEYVFNQGYKRHLLKGGMSSYDIEGYANELGIDFNDIDTLKPEEVDSIFKLWDIEKGNMHKNAMDKMASMKVRITKGEVGFFSNVNYLLNESLYASFEQAIKNNDVDKLKEFQEMKKYLHSQNKGLLPKTEQTSLDVKHNYGGLTIAEAPEWMRGMQTLLSANDKQINKKKAGISRMIDAVTGEGKVFTEGTDKRILIEYIFNEASDIAELAAESDRLGVMQFRSLYKLSQDNITREMFNSKAGKTINNVLEANKYRQHIEALAYKSTGTAEGKLASILAQSINVASWGFKDTDGVFHRFSKDAVYIGMEGEGLRTAKGYVLNKAKIDSKTNNVNVSFNVIDLDTQETVGKFRRSGTIEDVLDELQDMFGSHKEYALNQLKYDPDIVKDISEKTAKANTQRYADMMARNINKSPIELKQLSDDFLNTADFVDEAVEDVVEDIARSKKMIQNYNKLVDMDYFIDFRDKIRYIKSIGHTEYYDDINIASAFEDSITAINEQIINKGLNAKSSTSIEGIFYEQIKKIAKNPTIFSDKYFEEFKASQKSTNFADIFDFIYENIIDVNKAKKQLNSRVTEDVGSVIKSQMDDSIKKILNKYRTNNDNVIRNAKDSIFVMADTIDDLSNIFGWNTTDYSNMRVGSGSYFGRKFGDLTEDNIKEILEHSSSSIGPKNSFNLFVEKETKEKLAQFVSKGKIGSLSPNFKGATNEHIGEIITEMNNHIVKNLGKETEETVESSAKKAVKMAKKTLDSDIFGTVKEGFDTARKSTIGKVALGLAALGLVSNLLSSNQSPLTPESKPNGTSPSLNGYDGKRQPAPKSPNQKVIYTDNSSGLHYKMSAKSKQKLSQMNTAQLISKQNGGSTDINIYDDRSQVSANWLERKFSEII